jgi:ATP-dependent Clp protease protease subunit
MPSRVPGVFDKRGNQEFGVDIYTRLLKDRIIFIGSQIYDDYADDIVAQLLFLMSENKTQDINVYINCRGGSVTAGLAIYDTMQFLTCDIATYCMGQAASMGAVLLAAGTAGKRHVLPNSRIMIHQPWGGAGGTASDIVIQAREMKRNKELLNQILVKHTGQELTQIEEDTDRDFFMTAEQAQEYGLVDEVISTLKAAEPVH